MAYVPNNAYVFFQAFSGAVAGLLGQSTSPNTGRGAYTDTIQIAGAWAQEVDTVWASPDNPDQFEYAEIFAFSNDLFQVTEPQPQAVAILPATYAASANALLTVMSDAETYLGTLNITPSPIGASGLNFVRMQNAGGIHTQTQSAANPVAICAVAVQQKGNGLWEYDIDVSLASGTTAKTVELRAVLIPFTTAAQAFTQCSNNDPEVGPAYDGLAVGDLVAQLNADAAGVSAAGVLYGGAAPIDTTANAQTLWDRKVDTITGSLANGDIAFNAHGKAGYNSAGAQHTGFGFGKWAVLVLELVSTAGGDVVTFQTCSMSLREAA